MIFKTSKILDKNEAELNNTINKYASIPDSKVFNDSEEMEMKEQLASFQYTLEKCSLGNMVPPEFKDYVNQFDKANFEIDKLPKETRNTLTKTYNEFKYALKMEPGKFKNTAVNAYCIIFEFLTGKTFVKLYKKIKASKAAKKMGFGKENYSYMESLDIMLNDNNHNLNKAFMSSEAIGNIFRSKVGVLDGFKQFPGVVFDLRNLLTVLCIVLILITAAIIIMIIINMAHTTEMAKLLEKLTEKELQEYGGAEAAHCALVVQAAENMNSNLPISTKKFMIKPVITGINCFNKMHNKKPDALEKMIDATDKSSEDWENVDQSSEGAIKELFKEMTSNKFILGAGIIATVIFILIPSCKGMAYWFRHLKLKASLFFKNQNEWTETNIEYLMEKKNNPNTPQSEKDRLEKIIARQQKWAHNFATWSDHLYKTQIEAGNDARDEIREDENIDFQKIVEKDDLSDNDGSTTVAEEASTQEENERPSIDKPILVF